MQEFALYIDAKFSEIRRMEERPEDVERKGVNWYLVIRKTGNKPSEGLVDGEHVIVTKEPEPQPQTVFDFQAFMGLFTEGERKAIAGAAMVNVDVKLWYDQAVATNRIDLESKTVEAGLGFMVGAKLITQDRLEEILGTSIA